MMHLKKAANILDSLEKEEARLKSEKAAKESTLKNLQRRLKKVRFDEDIIAEHDLERG